MTFKVAVFGNGDDVFLAWDPGADIDGCLGFAIERRTGSGANVQAVTLENRVAFTDAPLPSGPMPSTAYPFQRLAWTDHGPKAGETVSYRITARIGQPSALRDGPASEWTAPLQLGSRFGSAEAYFNRGVVLSQFVARLMHDNGWSAADLKTHATTVHDRLRTALSGQLLLALLRLLGQAQRDATCHLYAALFELNDPDLVPALAALGARAHVVLANGAVKAKTDDENGAARATLRAKGVEVIDRFSAPAFLAHNKFAVLVRGGAPETVWTGSTNWQATGLCTQANNGLLVRDGALAATFHAAWQRLSQAGAASPRTLKQANTVKPPKVHKLADGSFAFAQFTAATGSIDIDGLLDLIAGARQSLLFAMFMPGAQVFDAAVGRRQQIFVRGVANTFPQPDANAVHVSLVDNGARQDFGLTAVQPQGIAHAFAAWAAEVTRQQFNAIGHAIIHSKVLVIDAWGRNPTVVTGSHNFSTTASTKNDENFVVISGNRALAQAYAVNVLGLYDHYRWRQYVASCAAQKRKPWSHLSTARDWLKTYRANADRQALLKAVGVLD